MNEIRARGFEKYLAAVEVGADVGREGKRHHQREEDHLVCSGFRVPHHATSTHFTPKSTCKISGTTQNLKVDSGGFAPGEHPTDNEFFGGLCSWAILKPSRTIEKVCTAANRRSYRVLKPTCSTNQIKSTRKGTVAFYRGQIAL